MKNMLRRAFRAYGLTHNTIRYRLEYGLIAKMLRVTGREFRLGLDAGAGSGEMSRMLVRDGFVKSVIGMEPCPDNYAMLVQNYKSVAGSRTIQAGLDAIPLEDASVDFVISTQVFEHIEDHETAAREVVRVLEPGGMALISTPHPPELFPNEGHVRPGYTEEEMRALFEPLGLTFVSSEFYLTDRTMERLHKLTSLPLRGMWVPVSMADMESDLSRDERKARQPYGIACLFAKPGK